MPPHAFGFVPGPSPGTIAPPGFESSSFSEWTVIEQVCNRPMMQARESFAACRPSRLLRNPAACRHHELHAIACCQVDRRLLVAYEKTISNEIHESFSNRDDAVQDRRPLISFEISRPALQSAQIFRIE